MLTKFSMLLCALALLVFTVGGAAAHQLQTEVGQLAIDRTTGTFNTAPQRANVEEGYRVYATPGSEGRIVYDNGCAQKVKPGRIYIVDPNRCRRGGGFWGAGAFAIAAGVGLGVGLSEERVEQVIVPAQQASP